MAFPIAMAIDRDRLLTHRENTMTAVSIYPAHTSRPLGSALIVALALAFAALPQAWAQFAQQQTASPAANGADRSIIFVGGRKQQSNTGSTAHARAHPPNPCTSTHARGSSVGDDCSLNPQPIPPGRSMHKRTPSSIASSSLSRTTAPMTCAESCWRHEEMCRAPGSKKGVRSCTVIYNECLQECK